LSRKFHGLFVQVFAAPHKSLLRHKMNSRLAQTILRKTLSRVIGTTAMGPRQWDRGNDGRGKPVRGDLPMVVEMAEVLAATAPGT
jgi:hypothetical protein